MMGSERPATSIGQVAPLLLLVQLFFGTHYLAAKLLLREFQPSAWALLRVSTAAAVMLVVCRVLGRPLPRSPALLLRLALLSLFGVVINQLCFIEGLARTTAAHSSILMTAIPIGTLSFAVLLGRERVSAGSVAALAVGLAGAMLVLRPFAAGVPTTMQFGDLLTLTNALSYALFLVLSKPILGRVDTLAATAVLLAFGSVGMLLPGLPGLLATDLRAISPQTWALGGFIVVFPTVASYLLTYWALARVASSVVGLFIYVQPVIATMLSVLVLGERLEPSALVGALLIFIAVYLALGAPLTTMRKHGGSRG